MKTPLIEGQRIFFNTIDKNLTHQDYKRVTEIAEDFGIYATGIGVSKKLVQFNPRETEEQFAQRVALTRPTTQDIFNSCVLPINKVGKTPAKEAFIFKNKDAEEKQSKKIIDASKNFYGKKSVKSYLVERMPQLDSTDPNGFIVVEYYNKSEKEGVYDYQAYPFEVNSKEAINYFYKNNILQWLVVKNDDLMMDKDGKEVPSHKYTIYLSNHSIVATQIHKDNVEVFKSKTTIDLILNPTNFNIDQELVDGKIYLLETNDKDGRFFALKVVKHDIGFVPANQVGSVADLATRARTYVPLIMPAQPYFEKAIKAVSEFDLSTCLHLFPQKIQYSDACEGQSINDELVPCNNGRNPEGAICKTCNGTGMKVHKSSMDLIQIRLPKNPEDLINLENLLVYKYPPIDLLKFQEELALHKYRYMANKAVYNSEVFARETTNTATEKIIDLDNVYDTLSIYAENWSEMYVFIMEAIAKLQDVDVEIYHAFPKDFKMLSTQQLLEQYKLANENNAPAYIKDALTRDISNKMYIDEPDELLKIETKEKFYPFPGRAETEISLIITNDMTTDKIKVLQTHFDYIFKELEFDARQEELNFYEFDEVKQKELINKKVEELIIEIGEQNNIDGLAFGATTNDES